MPRFLLSSETLETALTGDEFDLDADNAKKIVKVLRMAPGETFVAFSGFGREWECALTEVSGEGKARARAVLIKERAVENEQRVHLSIAQAIPKGDKMDLVLQKGTELGAAEFWPFEAERSVARVSPDDDAARATARAQRWRRIVEAACAQCGRADVPVVHAISDLATVVDMGTSGSRCFLLDESEDALSLREALKKEPIPFSDETPPRVMILIGPEGGWSAREREWAIRYGAEAIGLGKRILRTETAALVAAAILQWEAGQI